MSDNFIRIFTKMDVKHVKPNLLIYGDLGGQCAACQEMDIKLDSEKCPKCQEDFHFIAFRNYKSHIPKIRKLFDERPNITIIDYDDYKKGAGKNKAEELFG